jgi:hypothetical protein
MNMSEDTSSQPVLSPLARDDPIRVSGWLVMEDDDWSPMPSCAVSNKSLVVTSTHSAYYEDTDDDCWDSISKLDFDHEIIEMGNKEESKRPSNKRLVTSGSYRRLKKSLGSNESKRIKKSKKKLDALIKNEQVVL